MEDWYTGYSDLACWIPIVPPSLLPPAADEVEDETTANQDTPKAA